MGSQGARGLVHEVPGQRRRDERLDRLRELRAQDAEKRRAGHEDELVEPPPAPVLVELPADPARKQLSLMPARSSLAPRAVMRRRAAPGAHRGGAVENPAGPVGLEIAIVQARSRIAEATCRPQRRVTSLEVVETRFALVRYDDANAQCVSFP
jgi:hypothetical protein